ncbi:RpiB/LacA/LacB family sugar-phosphate isomerase [Phaeodactylibacter luteus]|uniref:RpiB/LacA/LacB family sugar-phosphate isomerase n=1 Tax=Phaeodactylibacter luteus TaxID=1564516 RepID=A0A5C6RV76_9BACT|nr:RpiB/LacA/LacB family sugar-phosphate isomerase [Phaeodactylibacter luteus]TXB66251.1 RpiB/LacA/LacB family sugar-phosphate isomerase [Phaeodactylibacter luteus]
MIIALGSDMDAPLVQAAAKALGERGHEVLPFGPVAAPDAPWPQVAIQAATAVAENRADQAILFCWTGTGISMAANKVTGVRAALCWDAPTAAGARQWNDANALAISLRYTTEAVLLEILDAWFGHSPSNEEADAACIRFLKAYDQGR